MPEAWHGASFGAESRLTKLFLNPVSDIYEQKWRALMDDFRTFLNEFVGNLPHIEIPTELGL